MMFMKIDRNYKKKKKNREKYYIIQARVKV